MSIPKLLPFLLTALAAAQDPGTTYRFRVRGLDPHQAHELEARYDILHSANRDGSYDVCVAPEDKDEFLRAVPQAVLVDRGRPYAQIVAEQQGPLAPDANYFTVAEVLQKMDQLAGLYPGLARRVDLATIPGAAKTHNGQSLWALKVSDAVANDEDEPAILIVGQHHARELNAPYMVIQAMERLLSGYASDPTLKSVVDGCELWFVPTVNPDGVDHVWNVDSLWRKNRRNNGSSYGVDNNRNYATLWGLCGSSTTPSSETYRGPSAASEPETQTMAALVAHVRPEVYLDFHSYGQEVLRTYAPCATVNPTIAAFLQRYVDDLRAPMTYNNRAPSGSGEAPEDHWVRSGTLSFLIEVGTSFQPVFSVTQTEEARVWPGIRRALTAWRPAVRGHVRSVSGLAPLAATITFAPGLFSHGEQTVARARDGRFGLWLPLGTWQVTFTAAGHQPYTKTVTVSAYDTPQTLEVDLEPIWSAAALAKQGSDRVGTTTQLTYTSAGDGGEAYWVALSGGTTPGIPLNNRTIPLNLDGILIASATPGAVLANNVGILPASGQAVAAFAIPPIPALAGITLYAGGITLGPGYASQVKKFSPALAIQIQP
ncbi:MAG: hypothetical protein IT458_13545 [Planctomycetes bacterium]|nr:hypothetical protein [Planctomycetota bacterium]